MNEPTIVNQKDAAKRLGVSPTKIKHLEQDGVIKRLPGRGSWYRVEDLDAWAAGEKT